MNNIFAFVGKKSRSMHASLPQMVGQPFLHRELTPEEKQAHDQNNERIEAAQEKMALPMPLNILKLVAYFAAVVCFIGLIRSGVSIQVAYHNAPVVFWIMPIAALLAAGITIYEKVKQKQYLKSADHAALIETLTEQNQTERAALGIPEKHIEVDVLGEFYEINKNGKKKNHLPATFATTGVYAWCDDVNLYLADNLSVYAFPLDDIAPLQYVKARVSTLGWNKEVDYRDDVYKPYKLTVNNIGAIFMPGYYVLPIKSALGEYKILFPNFEEKSATALAAFARDAKASSAE